MKIKKKSFRQFKGRVFDLTVENSHSYNVNGVAVHNSAAGSLILYLLKVTNVDPIPNNLFFERFVSKSRAKKVKDKSGKEFLVGSLLPDVDSDISYDQRQRVIEYIETTHAGRTSKILTFNTFSSKLCIREAAKYFDEAKEDDASIVSDLIPKNHGVVSSLKKSVEENEHFKTWSKIHQKAYENALKIEDLYKNTGVHPSGIAISAASIEDTVPLQKTKEGAIVSGYDMHDVSDLMVKFDVLGLRTLTIADNTCKKLGISLDDVDVNDPFIYQVLQDFRHPVGLFQISADTNFKVCQQVKPDCLGELSDVVALARPASLQFLNDYVEQKKAPKKLGLNAELDKILQDSKNVMLYQESLMTAVSKVFGLSLDDAESLRRTVGKKKLDEIPAWKKRIFDAAEKNGVSKEAAEYFWNVVEASGNYAFNKCIFELETVETDKGRKSLKDVEIGDFVRAFCKKTKKDCFVEVIDKIDSVADVYEIETENGKKIKCSLDHKFLTPVGMLPMREIINKELPILSDCPSGNFQNPKAVVN